MAKVKSERLKSGNIIKMRDASNKPRGYFRVASVKKSRDNPAMVQVSGQWKGAPGTGGHHGDFGKSVSLPFEKGEEWELVQAKDIKETTGFNAATLEALTEIREKLEEAYSPVKEIEGQFTKAVGYCLKHGLLELSDTKEIMKTVKAVANRRHR
jgi:hypothetical protein